MILLDFIFQNGEFEITQNFKPAFPWATVISPIVAVLLFIIEKTFSKRKERATKRKENQDALLYFKSLYLGIGEAVSKQTEAYKEHSNRIKSEPIKFHLMTFYVIADLDRILDKLDQRIIFNSYLKEYFPKKEELGISEIKEVYGNLDFYKLQISEAYKSHLKYRNDLSSQLNLFIEIFNEEIVSRSAKLLMSLDSNEPNASSIPVYDILSKFLEDLMQESEEMKSDLDHLQNRYINNLREKLFDYINETGVYELMDNCRKATWILSVARLQSISVSKEFLSYHLELKAKLDLISNKSYFNLKE